MASKATTTAWAETVALTAAVPLAGYLLDPLDPFFLGNPFSWLIFPPLLLSLRYGLRYGMASAGSFALGLGVGWWLGWEAVSTFPTALIIGLLGVTLVCGEFQETRERREHSLEITLERLQSRMNQFVPLYQILKSSHSQLEQKLGRQTLSLRDSLSQLEQQIMNLERNEESGIQSLAWPILEFFCTHASILAATLHATNAKEQLALPALASFGNPNPVWPSNFLLREVFRTRNVANIQPDWGDAVDGVLAVVPLIDVEDRIRAVVVINEMSLFDFNHQTLTLLAVLGGRVGDLLRRRSQLRIGSGPREAFEDAVRRAYQELRQFKLPAAIIGGIFPKDSDTQDNTLAQKFLMECRGSDRTWTFLNTGDQKVIVKLLALTDAQALDACLRRIAEKADEQRGGIAAENAPEGSIVGWCLSTKQHPKALLGDIYKRFGIGFSVEAHSKSDATETAVQAIPDKD